MRKALVIGIDYYESINPLAGCVNDAYAVKAMLDRHADGSINFGTRLMVGTGPQDIFKRSDLKEAVRELFIDDGEVALFYFAGHGYIESTGGYLCAGDCKTGDDGLPLAELMTLANGSKARNKIMILDSCYSGALGDHPINTQLSEISEGVTILTASTKGQYAADRERWRRLYGPPHRRSRWCCRQPGRGRYARECLCPHRSVTRHVEPPSGIQDQRQGVRISPACAASAPLGGPSAHFGVVS